jgi:predicted small lipoprotein YifL
MKKVGIVLLLIALVSFVAGCIEESPAKIPETQKSAPTTQIKSSLERDMINKWIDEVGNPNNIMWLYHMSESGQVLGEWPIVGKAVSMTKSNEPYDRIVDCSGASTDDWYATSSFSGFRAGTAQLANPSGTYGHDLEGVFFFTPDGEYHEIHGGIIHVSSVPLKIKEPVFLTYDIDKEKQEKEKQWESDLANKKPITNLNITGGV